jgi:hypothetical protein
MIMITTTTSSSIINNIINSNNNNHNKNHCAGEMPMFMAEWCVHGSDHSSVVKPCEIHKSPLINPTLLCFSAEHEWIY